MSKAWHQKISFQLTIHTKGIKLQHSPLAPEWKIREIRWSSWWTSVMSIAKVEFFQIILALVIWTFQERQKGKKLEEIMKQMDREMQRTDELLYQMIPKSVADRLRKGESAMSTCQVRNRNIFASFQAMMARSAVQSITRTLFCVMLFTDTLRMPETIKVIPHLGSHIYW